MQMINTKADTYIHTYIYIYFETQCFPENIGKANNSGNIIASCGMHHAQRNILNKVSLLIDVYFIMLMLDAGKDGERIEVQCAVLNLYELFAAVLGKLVRARSIRSKQRYVYLDIDGFTHTRADIARVLHVGLYR